MLYAIDNSSCYEPFEDFVLVEKIKNAINRNLDSFATKLAKAALHKKDFLSISEEITKLKPELIAPALEEAIQYNIDKIERESTIPKNTKNFGKTERNLNSIHGEIKISRTMIYDPSMKKCAYPAEVQLGIIPDKSQLDIKKAIEKLAIELPFAEAAKLVNELTGLELSIGSIHQATVDIGACATPENVLPNKNEILEKIQELKKKHSKETPILVGSFDGAFEPTRAEESTRKGSRGKGEWKEAKGFRFYLSFKNDIYQIASWHQIGTDEELSKVLEYFKDHLKECDLKQVIIADGAKWIWKLVDRHFPKSIQILDYYHFSEHLSKFADIQYGKGQIEGKDWLDKCKEWVFLDKAQSIIRSLQRINYKNSEAQKAATDLITYIENNLHKLNYQKFKEQDFPIGSGGMESANKFICHVRLKRSGCWWKPSHANEILRQRCAKFNNKTDNILEAYKNRVLKEQKELIENNKNGMKKMIAPKNRGLVYLQGGKN